MSSLSVTLQALAPLFVLVLLGTGLKRLRVLHASHVATLNSLVVLVTMPALVLHGLIHAASLPAAAIGPVLSFLLAEAAVMALVYAACRMQRLEKPVTGALLMVGIFGNTGFLGYPMVLALMKASFPMAILLDQFSMSIPMFLSIGLLGSIFGTAHGGATRAQSVLRVLVSPLFAAVLLGLLVHMVPWPSALLTHPAAAAIGSCIDRCLAYLGQGTIPIVLLAFGVSLRPGVVRSDVRPVVLASISKLIVFPVVADGLCHLLHVAPDLRRVAILLACMPTSVMASVLCAQNDLAGDTATRIVFITTVLGAITIPLMTHLLH